MHLILVVQHNSCAQPMLLMCQGYDRNDIINITTSTRDGGGTCVLLRCMRSCIVPREGVTTVCDVTEATPTTSEESFKAAHATLGKELTFVGYRGENERITYRVLHTRL